jgi:mono/diheme cytochrome c family protein
MLSQFKKKAITFGISLALSFALPSCRRDSPTMVYMPDMVYSPALKAQQPGAERPPVPGTVSRDFQSYPYAKDPEKAGKELVNPLRPTKKVLLRGRQVFNTNCIVCHGPTGMGDGPIVPKFPRPQSLQSDKVRGWPDGSIYHVITMGQNLMPGYASQIDPADRWAVIHYVRVLQRSQNPTEADLKFVNEESK